MKKYIGAAMFFLSGNEIVSLTVLLVMMLMFIYDIAKAAKEKGVTL